MTIFTRPEMRDVAQLEDIARRLRFKIIQTSSKTGTPHLASCLSCVDILVALYFDVMDINPQNPRDENRDRFVLSKGHAAPALFQTLAARGYYPEVWLDKYGEDGGIFAEHPPTPDQLAGIEAATGSLGHGFPMGVGMSLSGKIKSQPYRTYVVLGDGECNEGTIWEAAMFAAAQKLSRLCVIIDFNKWQATDRSREVLALDPLADKWRAFGWRVKELDGHNIPALISAFAEFQCGDQPMAIVAHTIKGRGVSFMEDDNNWHYRIPTAEEVEMAKAELGLV